MAPPGLPGSRRDGPFHYMATIPASVHIVGDARTDENLAIAGIVRGNIHVRNADVTVAEQATITGDIRAARIRIRGGVAGTVSASERIELAASASVSGHISADHVVVLEGAQVNAPVDMNRRTLAAMVARHKAES